MQHYQLLLVVPGNVSEEDAQDTVTAVTTLIEGEKGVITRKDAETFGKRRLAYAIKHIHYGYYTIVEFDVAEESLAKIDQEIRHNADVMRHQIVTIVHKTEEQKMAEASLREKIQTKRRRVEEDEKKQEREERVKEVTKPETYKKVSKEERKATIEELDKKLDEILSDDI